MNVLLFLFLTCAWGGAYLGIHYVIGVYPPFFAAALRVLCSTVLMLPFAWSSLRRANLPRGTIVRCAVSGLIFTGGGFLLLLSALTETWPSRAVIVHASAANFALAFLIIVPSTIAFLIYYHLIRAWGSVAATTTVFTVPLVSLLLDVVALRQVPAWPVLVGAVIIFSGVYRVKRVREA